LKILIFSLLEHIHFLTLKNTMIEISLKYLTQNDLDQIMEIENEAFTSPWTKGAYLNELDNNTNCKYIVARIGNELVGYIGSWFYLKEIHITTIAVSKKWRCKKIGKLVLWYLLSFLMALNAKFAILEVRQSNITAQNLYEKFGFKNVGIRKNYYPDKENAVIMHLEDLDKNENIKQNLKKIGCELKKKFEIRGIHENL